MVSNFSRDLRRVCCKSIFLAICPSVEKCRNETRRMELRRQVGRQMQRTARLRRAGCSCNTPWKHHAHRDCGDHSHLSAPRRCNQHAFRFTTAASHAISRNTSVTFDATCRHAREFPRASSVRALFLSRAVTLLRGMAISLAASRVSLLTVHSSAMEASAFLPSSSVVISLFSNTWCRCQIDSEWLRLSV